MNFSISLIRQFDPDLRLTENDINHWLNIGPANVCATGLCTYAMNEKFLKIALANENVSFIFAPMGTKLHDLSYAESDDPRYDFFRFHNWFVSNGLYKYYPEYPDIPIKIGTNTEIDEAAQIAAEGLRVIRKRDGTTFRCLHGGYVEIGNDCRIGSLSVIVRSVWRTPTIIRNRVHIGNRVTIGHNTVIEDDVIIAPGAIICGRAVVKSGATIGAGAIINNGIIIGEGAIVSAASLVTRDVAPGQRVTGNFAVNHDQWVRFVKGIAVPETFL
jgi:acetyltransferase-like isoleucine patch superfamily enzyme